MTGSEFDNYKSPFSWRYGSDEMRSMFSEKTRRTKWRKIWYEIASSQYKHGLISKAELNDIKKYSAAKHVDIKRSLETEKKINVEKNAKKTNEFFIILISICQIFIQLFGKILYFAFFLIFC